MTLQASRKCLLLAAALAAVAMGAARAANNPLAREPAAAAPIDGAWNGSDIERRTNCTGTQNNGTRGTYAQFNVSTDPVAHTLGIDQLGITGLNCTYVGDYAPPAWNGTYSCTDGKRGSFHALGILHTQYALSIHLAIQLDTTETCAIDAVIGAGRAYP